MIFTSTGLHFWKQWRAMSWFWTEMLAGIRYLSTSLCKIHLMHCPWALKLLEDEGWKHCKASPTRMGFSRLVCFEKEWKPLILYRLPRGISCNCMKQVPFLARKRLHRLTGQYAEFSTLAANFSHLQSIIHDKGRKKTWVWRSTLSV